MQFFQYLYPDDSRSSARQFVHNDSTIPASYLAQRDGETDAEWIARLRAVNVTPIRITPSCADPNQYDAGDSVETTTEDGVIEITYPDPVAKTPVWHKQNREQMYISAGADVPNAYTPSGPPYGVYSVWNAEAGEWGENTDRQATAIRVERDRLLAECDWTQLADASLNDITQRNWTTYRQALRDIPQQTGFPWAGDLTAVPWPDAPGEATT